MKTYDKYKYSGIDWIGDVPDHWEIKKLKYWINSTFGGGTPSTGNPNYWNGNIPWVSPKDMKSDFITKTEDYISENAVKESATSLIPPNRVLIVVRSGILKHKLPVAINKVEVSLNQDMKAFEPISKLLPVFLFWKLKGQSSDILTTCNKIGATVDSLEMEDLFAFPFALPPLDEQTAIADYLDENTAQIDKLINEKRRLIELLKEERSGVINQAVTRGINPHAKLKSSGIAWLGDIPEHWVVVSIGYRFEVQLGKMLDEKRITGKHLAPYLRNTDVQWQKINTIDLPVMDFSEEDREKFSLKNGDLLVCEGGEVGRCAIWREEISDCFYQKALHRIRPVNKEKDSTEFLFYLMLVASERGLFTATGNSNIIQHLPAEKLRKHQFPFPPIEEQKQIVEFIETAAAKIDATIAQIEKEIGFMREYRTALISEVVTGKIRVI